MSIQSAGRRVAISPSSRQQRGVGVLCGEASIPTLASLRERNQLAQSLLGHRAITDLELQVLAVLRGEVEL